MFLVCHKEESLCISWYYCTKIILNLPNPVNDIDWLWSIPTHLTPRSIAPKLTTISIHECIQIKEIQCIQLQAARSKKGTTKNWNTGEIIARAWKAWDANRTHLISIYVSTIFICEGWNFSTRYVTIHYLKLIPLEFQSQLNPTELKIATNRNFEWWVVHINSLFKVIFQLDI